MALFEYKVPIITGRNDVPTTSEFEENHPNGSFTTAKYNALIENLPTELMDVLLKNWRLILIYDLSGRYLSSSGTFPPIIDILGLEPVTFTYNNQSYLANQINSFWFGDLTFINNNINFTLNTTSVTFDLLIPITIFYGENDTYPLNCDIVISSTLVDSISADPGIIGGSGS